MEAWSTTELEAAFIAYTHGGGTAILGWCGSPRSVAREYLQLTGWYVREMYKLSMIFPNYDGLHGTSTINIDIIQHHNYDW
jgi:hypothetical protein